MQDDYIIEGLKRAIEHNPIRDWARHIARTEVIREDALFSKCRKAGIPDPDTIAFLNFWRDERTFINQQEMGR